MLDLGGAPAGTKVKISKIYFEQDNTVGYDDDANMWKAVDNGSSFLSFETWFANNDWQTLEPQPEIKHDGNAYTFTVPEGTGGAQWQGQLKIHTNLTAELASIYNFSCKIEMDNDAQGVTIKLTEDGDDNNFFFGDRHNVTADKAFVYSAKGVTLPINQGGPKVPKQSPNRHSFPLMHRLGNVDEGLRQGGDQVGNAVEYNDHRHPQKGHQRAADRLAHQAQGGGGSGVDGLAPDRSEEHTSELHSRE